MNSLVTYDVSTGQTEVKDALKEISYLDYWVNDSVTYTLPETTLWKKNARPSKVVQEIKSVLETLNKDIPLKKNKIVLERCVAVKFDLWAGIEGEEYSE